MIGLQWAKPFDSGGTQLARTLHSLGRLATTHLGSAANWDATTARWTDELEQVAAEIG